MVKSSRSQHHCIAGCLSRASAQSDPRSSHHRRSFTPRPTPASGSHGSARTGLGGWAGRCHKSTNALQTTVNYGREYNANTLPPPSLIYKLAYWVRTAGRLSRVPRRKTSASVSGAGGTFPVTYIRTLSQNNRAKVVIVIVSRHCLATLLTGNENQPSTIFCRIFRNMGKVISTSPSIGKDNTNKQVA